MLQPQLAKQFLNQSKDLFWVVDNNFLLIEANQAYLSFMKEVAGVKKKLNDSAFIETFGKEDIEKWRLHYKRALRGESFQIEEHFFNKRLHQIEYSQITFEPLINEKQEVFAVACQSKDITSIVQEKIEVHQLIDASLDIFCAVNEEGIFVALNGAVSDLWGFTPKELIGTPFMDLVIEEDVPKTEQVATDIIQGKSIKSFVNRYKRKDGGIAFNLWSTRYDKRTKLMYGVVRDAKEKIEQEEKLLQSEQHFKALVQDGSDLIGILDAEGNYIYVSPTSNSVLGIPPEEFIGRNAFEFIHPDDKERVLSSLQLIQTENKITLEPFRFQNYKNEWRWVETVLTNMVDNPAVNGIVANSRDITEKIEQEEKLLQSEQRFKALVTGVFDLVGVVDSTGHYLYMSPSCITITGIPPEGFIGKNAFEFVHPDDIDQTLAHLKESTISDKVVMKPYRAKNLKNEWRWVESVLTNMLDNTAINGIVVNSRDITDKVEQEKKIIQTEKRFETLIQKSKDCIVILSSKGKTKFVSSAIKKTLGYKQSEVKKMDFWALIHPEDRKVSKAAYYQIIESPNTPLENFTIRLKHKDGSWRWIKPVVTNLIQDPSIGGIVVVFRDVTKQKAEELEKELINNIATIFNQNVEYSLINYLKDVCEKVVEFENYSFTEIWLPSADNKTLTRAAKHAGNKSGKIFFNVSEKVNSLESEGGLSDHVFKKKKIGIWSSNDDKWDLLKRITAANKAGIKTLIGIPLIHNNELVGGLLIGAETAKKAHSSNLGLFRKLQSIVGSELSRKKIEDELAQIFDFTPDMICVAGFDGYIKRINPAGLKILGYSLEEICSKPIKSFVHKDDQLRTAENQNKLYNGKNIQNFENRYITKEGKAVWLSWNASTSIQQGVVYAVAKDITVEKNLRELNEQVGALAKIGSWELDLINKTIFWSREVHLIHETDPETFIPSFDKAINFYREDFHELIRANVEKCIYTGESYEMDAVVVTAKKKELWVKTNGSAEFIDGECRRIYGSIQEINERKQSEMRLDSFVNNLPGVAYQYHIDAEGKDSLQHVSKQAKEIWGFSAKEVMEDVGLPWAQIEAGGDLEKVHLTLTQSIQKKRKWVCRYKYVHPNGELRTHLGHGTPRFLADGSIIFSSVVLDVTQQAKNEELLERTAKVARVGSWEMNLINQDGDSMYWSPMLMKIVEVGDNYSPTLTGGIEFHVGESKDRIQNALNLLITKGIEFDEEILLLTAKGNERWCRAIGKSEILHNKRTKIFGSYQDIHERKLAEENLRITSERLKLATTTANIGIWDWDIVNNHLIWDELMYRIFGVSKDKFEGAFEAWSSTIHPEDIEYATEEVQNALKGLKKFNTEFRVVWPDKSIRYVTGNAYVVRDNDTGEPLRMVGTNIDITEKRVAEKEKDSFRITVENSLNEIYVFDANTMRFKYVNKGSLLNLGYSQEEIKKLTPVEIKPDYSKSSFKKLVKPLVNREKDKIIFFTHHKRKDGSIYPVEVHLQLVTEGYQDRFLAVVIDITDRKKAEEEILIAKAKIEASEAKFKSYTEKSPIAIYTTNLQGDCTYVNEMWKKLTGLSTEEALGKGWLKALHPEDLDLVKNNWFKSIESKGLWKYEYRFLNKKREVVWVEGTAKELFNEKNELLGYLGTNVNITDRKKAEEEIIQANERFQKVTEATNDAIWDWDIVGNKLYRSKAIESFFGKGTTLALSKKDFWTDRFHRNDIHRVDKSVQEAIADPSCFKWEAEYRLYNTENKLIYVIDRGVIVRDEHGKAIRMVGSMTNITELKESEKKNKFKANLLKTIGQAVVATDLDGIVNYWNTAAENIYGWKREEALGKDAAILTPADTNQKQVEEILNLLKKGQTWTGEFEVWRKDKTKFPVRVSNSPVYDDDKNISGMIGISSDITEEVKNKQLLEQYTKELERSNEELEQFAFIASHDLQEPLRMISSFMDLLQKKYGDQLDEKGNQYVHFATDGAKRMKQIILDLLQYSRSTKPLEGKEKVNLNSIITNYKQSRGKLISEKSAHIKLSKLPTLSTYKAAITQVFHCLIDNAIKYSVDGTPPIVEINVTESKDKWEFSIQDNGIGIDPKFHEKVFIIFQRLHNRADYEGTGIGLPIAKKHVELLGGKIWLKSEQGKGATFYFTIPKTI